MYSLSRGLACALLVAGALSSESPAQAVVRHSGPQNFIYFGRDRSRISEDVFLRIPSVVGAQLKYTWRELEPERDVYNLRLILDDLAYLEQHGKRLFIQLQDVSFEETIINVPDYLLDDPAFGGGVARQYEYDNDEEAWIGEGWVARRWDPSVRERFVRLLRALGEALDGRIEGLNLPETAIGLGGAELQPPGFSPQHYADGIKAIMTAAREAFRRSQVIQYANFMPGEALPGADNGYLRSIYDHADASRIGVGGPDLLPHRRGQQTHSLPLIAARGPNTIAGLAVQWGNLEDVDHATGRRVTVAELYRFARERLRLDYVFWGTQEPYYSRDILPFLRDLRQR